MTLLEQPRQVPMMASTSFDKWTVHAHCRSSCGRDFAMLATFSVGDVAARPCLLHWSLIDIDAGMFRARAAMCSSAVSWLREAAAAGTLAMDRAFNEALVNVLVAGRPPAPVRSLANVGCRDTEGPTLQFGDDELCAVGKHAWTLRLSDPASRSGGFLLMKPDGAGSATPRVARCEVAGHLLVDGMEEPIESGMAWLLRHRQAVGPSMDEPQRTLLCTRLDDGTTLHVELAGNGELRGEYAPPGRLPRAIDERDGLVLEVTETWRSARTFNAYPLRWRLRAPDLRLDLHFDALRPDQEIVVAPPALGVWAGIGRVTGIHGGQKVSGSCTAEHDGRAAVRSQPTFLKTISELVCDSVDRIMPRSIASQYPASLMTEARNGRYLNDVDPAVISRSLIEPIRTITDRGGKGWRSCFMLLACQAVGGEAERFLDCMGAVELLQTGSLIVDDVEDGSAIRRGGPACHLMFGVPLAVNAGTFCYFMAQQVIQRAASTPAVRLRVYDAFADLFTAAHIGQSIDLMGYEPGAVDRMLETGAVDDVVQQVLATYRLKAAMPVAIVVRIGATLGGGSDEQIAALERYFEAIGMAFQIADDVLNLRGFEHDGKQRGEDLTAGKLTIVVAQALAVLGRDDRARLWQRLRARPTDPGELMALRQWLEDCGAMDASMQLASRMLDETWAALDPLIEDSTCKMLLKGSSALVLERKH